MSKCREAFKNAFFTEPEHADQAIWLRWKFAWDAATENAAKVCERLISGDGICADDGVWIHDCAEAIRKEKTE
jgi:hypothetical protein